MVVDLSKVPLLSHIKYLYADLRDRINAKYVKPVDGIPASDLAIDVIPIASLEETQEIINTYEEEDEGMLVTANFTTTNYPHFVTEEDAADIKAAIKSGKYVMVLFKHSSESEQYHIMTDTYLPIVGIDEGNGIEGEYLNDMYLLGCNDQTGIAGSFARNLSILNEQGIENGKLTFGIYID